MFATDQTSRRHFLRHMAAGAATVPALQFLSHLEANAQEVRRNGKAVILVWLGGGAPTIDMWDLKPGTNTGGEFKPIDTKGDLQISEHLPKTAMVMDELSVVRSMSSIEADHDRGRYFMKTGYRPEVTATHPHFGSVVSYEIGAQRPQLEIPAFISISSGGGQSGYLGMRHAPFEVSSNGQIRNASLDRWTSPQRLQNRLAMLNVLEENFIKSGRGDAPQAHADVYDKAVNLMTSSQMDAFKVEQEDEKTREAYGTSGLGRGLLMARRLVERGVPFVEVGYGGWDLHNDVFNSLSTDKLPTLDAGLSAVTADLKQRGLLQDTVVVCMGEFGRTPRINQNVGRDHWARSWSVLIGGGGLTGGIAVGKTSEDGMRVDGPSYLPGDLWATVAQAIGIPLNTVHTSKTGRPMKLANGGRPIAELIG
ncbi:DUF1501 domain-containing protein [Alienimonas sp. DA493]|uniref:DUF1501 domain-containing protein n=1 Tax=Alienimonas sp. DA493 TaxID=3373605 RepID=UPI003754E5AF